MVVQSRRPRLLTGPVQLDGGKEKRRGNRGEEVEVTSEKRGNEWVKEREEGEMVGWMEGENWDSVRWEHSEMTRLERGITR